MERLLGIDSPGVVLEALLHFGTLVSVVYLFRQRIAALLRAPFTRKDSPQVREQHKFLALLVVATLPTALIGLLFESWFERAFESTLTVGISLLITGALLFALERLAPAKSENPGTRIGVARMGFLDAVWVGIMQGAAIVPGISRSGFTIATGILRGLDRKAAAEFSFILAIPAILGATGLQLFRAVEELAIHRNLIGDYLIGAVVAAVSGIVSIKALLYLLLRSQLDRFAYYCWGIGISAILWTLL